jgi:hypothetical protein
VNLLLVYYTAQFVYTLFMAWLIWIRMTDVVKNVIHVRNMYMATILRMQCLLYIVEVFAYVLFLL